MSEGSVRSTRSPFASLSSTITDPANTSFSSQFPIIVHCHLHWDWVWQRPQQFLSRLARRHRVLFIEGPTVVPGDDAPRAHLRQIADHPNITIMTTQFSQARWHDGAWVDSERRRLLSEVLAGPLAHRFDNAVQWFYDPMAVSAFAKRMGESLNVYDCMDELSQFKGAPPELIQRERKLLQVADVVFAGGRKMHESKSRFNANCHFYGCGVDVKHFNQAREEGTAIPDDIAHLQGPILGYFGVVDERLDYELIARLADADPDWNIVMVGPSTKVDPAELPRRPNIHWLGGRDYLQLPSYTKAFDACLMPFALNEATEYINPTKALEYMATATPIVSTAVPDVVSNFSQVVQIAKGPEEFIAMCRAAVFAPDAASVERGVKMANENTWDAIVACLEKHVEEALLAKAARSGGSVSATAHAANTASINAASTVAANVHAVKTSTAATSTAATAAA